MTPDPDRRVPRRELAPGYSVPRIINGGWQLSRGHRRHAVAREAAVSRLLRLVEAGLDTFDCGDIYVGVEELLGAVRRAAPHIQIHTKLVPDRDDLARVDQRYVERIVDRSLRRLGVERLDMVQLSWWDYAVPGYVKTALWLDRQRQAGKIRLLGATNFDVPRLREIVEAGVPVTTHQVQYSLLDRRPERGMVGFCGRHGIGLLVYGALAGGFLSNRHLGQAEPPAAPENRSLVKYGLIIDEFGGWRRFQDLLRRLQRIAATHGVSIANVAARWVLDAPGVAAVNVGVFDDAHLDDNLRVFDLRLTDDDRRLLEPFRDAGPAGDVYDAERVPGSSHAAIMKYNLNRETDT